MMEKNRQIGLRINILVAIAVMLFLSAGSLFASDDDNNESSGKSVKFNDWEIVGPSGGDVRVITIDPRDKDRLYIGTLDGQIHTSGDGGKTWRLLVNFNKPQLILDQLFVDSRDSNIIYASGHRHKEPGAFFKTTDGGATWKEAKELRGESIHSMVQSKLDPNVILVGTINGIWVSEDSGDDWKKISSDTMPTSPIGSLAIDPRTNDTIFAGTWWRAYKSTDSGKSWRLIKNGMIDDSDVFAITIDSKNPNHIIASACSGIYESLNNGEKWAKVNGIPSQSRRTRDIVQNPSIPGAIYAATTEGFWMTSNGGKAWMLTTQRDLEINSIAVHPDAPNRIFIGTNNYGVMVSNDGGKNFTTTNDNFTSRFTYSITPDIERPNRLYATTQNTATGGGFVFTSNDGGLNWQQAENLDISRISPFSIIQDRVNTDTMYLATNVGIFTSLDRGNSWEHIAVPKPSPPKKTTTRRSSKRGKPVKAKAPALVEKPEIAPATPGIVPVLENKVKVLSYTEDGKNGIFAGTEKGLYRSYDILKGWEKIPLGEGIDENIFVVYSTPQQPETIWVGTSVSGLIISRDNGATWQKVAGIPENAPVSSITIDPKRPDYVYVGTSHSFFLSRDGGKTFTRRGGNLPLGNYTSILVNPRNTDEVYTSSALQSDGGIFYSDNAGMNWKRIDSKDLKLPSHRVWSMIFDPNDSNRIFAGTHSSGVYLIERTVKGNIAEKTPPKDNFSRPRVTGN
jgi:photosystem II stability/assembly factor-like uncharacterized protein